VSLVVDTDVIAAALLGEPGRGRQAGALLAFGERLLAPAHWQAELANVVWKATVMGLLPVEAVDELIATAARLSIESVAVTDLWRGAVARAIVADHPVYDTLFIELAERSKTRVASYDRALRKKFPELVVEPSALIA
jgi:predicted nucleic acid-binding protein